MNSVYKNLIAACVISFTLSGCSGLFGIGYENSVSEESKTFGITGSPKTIYKYKEKIKKIQSDYVNSKIEEVLYFAINKEGEILVKEDRDADFEFYSISEWKIIIEESLEELKSRKAERLLEEQKLNEEENEKVLDLDYNEKKIKNINLEKEYIEQDRLLITTERIGNIVRDNGMLQTGMVFNYVDTNDILNNSHEITVIIKNPKWIVGNSTPKVTNKEFKGETKFSDKFVFHNNVSNYDLKLIDSFNDKDDSDSFIIKEEKDKKIKNKHILDDFIEKDKNKKLR
jgi:hypothetical protein